MSRRQKWISGAGLLIFCAIVLFAAILRKPLMTAEFVRYDSNNLAIVRFINNAKSETGFHWNTNELIRHPKDPRFPEKRLTALSMTGGTTREVVFRLSPWVAPPCEVTVVCVPEQRRLRRTMEILMYRITGRPPNFTFDIAVQIPLGLAEITILTNSAISNPRE